MVTLFFIIKIFQYSQFKEEAFQNSTKFNISLISDFTILRKLKFVGVRPLETGIHNIVNNQIISYFWNGSHAIPLQRDMVLTQINYSPLPVRTGFKG